MRTCIGELALICVDRVEIGWYWHSFLIGYFDCKFFPEERFLAILAGCWIKRTFDPNPCQHMLLRKIPLVVGSIELEVTMVGVIIRTTGTTNLLFPGIFIGTLEEFIGYQRDEISLCEHSSETKESTR